MIFMDAAGHLITDSSEEELHIFAKKIGLKKAWFQNKGIKSHYDLTTENMRKRAQLSGAVLVSSKEIIRILKKRIF